MGCIFPFPQVMINLFKFHNRQPMNFSQCPYNENHVFNEEKYVWHINRCKDKSKVKKKFKECRFNSLHILPVDQLIKHEEKCPDRLTANNRSKFLKNVIKSCTWTKTSEKTPERKISIQPQIAEGESLSECEECQALLKSIENGDLPTCKKLKKLLRHYEDIQESGANENKTIKKEELRY